MQQINMRKVLSGKERFNMDRRSIPNPKSSKSLRRGGKQNSKRDEEEHYMERI
jgi:hypothetical protein